MSDEKVIATADDAVLSKLWTSSMGYYSDPFLPHFAKDAHGVMASTSTTKNSSNRRVGGQPMMRRGTFARVCCVDRAISFFLSSTEQRKQQPQIVILGAGKDTTYLRYQAELLTSKSLIINSLQWYEVDLPTVQQNKHALLNSLPQNLLTKSRKPQYHLVPFDLRAHPTELFHLLTNRYNFNVTKPTLYIVECVFMYLSEEASRRLLTAAAKLHQEVTVVIYDPVIQISSPFGEVMYQHLKRAGVIQEDTSSSIQSTPTIPLYLKKLIDCGFPMAVGCSMSQAYETILSPEQRRHASSVEMLDELEEWTLLMNHYCFIVASSSFSRDDIIISNNAIAPSKGTFGFSSGKCIQME